MKKLNYKQVGDYYVPDLKTPINKSIGKYGRLKLHYLKECHPGYLFSLQVKGELNDYLDNVDMEASKMFDTLIKQYQRAYHISEELKENKPMLWIQKMNNIKNLVEEIIKNELIYN